MKNLFQPYSIGHFVNQPSNVIEFEITHFQQMEDPDLTDVHKHSFYEILWVDQGTSAQTIDFKTYDLQAKSLFFISPGQVHEFEKWQGLKGGTIMFTEDFFLRNQQDKDKLFELGFLDNVYFNPNLQLGPDEYKSIRHCIDLLISEKNRDGSMPEILQSLLHILLLQIQRCIRISKIPNASRRNIIIFKQFKNILEFHFSKGLIASQYAEKLNITEHHLNRIVKEITGQTAGSVIKARTILEAKRLLSFTDFSIGDIASQLNYFDASYFSKIFKSCTGKSPIEFKVEMSKKYKKEQVLL
jgi:AraC-like DNA-binding protein